MDNAGGTTAPRQGVDTPQRLSASQGGPTWSRRACGGAEGHRYAPPLVVAPVAVDARGRQVVRHHAPPG